MHGVVVLGGVVTFVGGPWSPVEPEHALRLSASEPMESHVHCLGEALQDLIVDDPICLHFFYVSYFCFYFYFCYGFYFYFYSSSLHHQLFFFHIF